jgi:hypothetical protein
MRLYIYKITRGDKCPIYHFTRTIETAWFWDTRERVDEVCRATSHDGITIEPTLGMSTPCTDFRVEPRPQGGFAISCEHPFASN